MNWSYTTEDNTSCFIVNCSLYVVCLSYILKTSLSFLIKILIANIVVILLLMTQAVEFCHELFIQSKFYLKVEALCR